jgi:hypothetical protein
VYCESKTRLKDKIMNKKLIRYMIVYVLCNIVLFSLCIGCYATNNSQGKHGNPIEIGTRLELFVDHYLIDTMIGVDFKLHEPCEKSLNGFPDSVIYNTVLIKKEGFYRYRMYYRHTKDPKYYYIESRNGIHWGKPEPLLDVTGGRENEILESHDFSPFLDHRPDIPEYERYKTFKRIPPSGESDLYAYGSKDGIKWSKISDEPAIDYDSTLHGRFAFDTQNVSFWSEAEQCYVAYFRHFKTPHGTFRTIGRATSKDFLNWTDESATFETPNLPGVEPEKTSQSQSGPFPAEQLYTNQTHPYFRAPHIYIALPTRYTWGWIKGEYFGKNIGTTDIMFMTTRAGANSYERLFKEAFIRPGLAEESWDTKENYVALNVVPTGPSEMSIYHGRSNVKRYVLRTDGFVSVNAPWDGGELITKPLLFEGKELVLNLSTAIRGGIRVELQNAEGEALPGFSLDDCEPIIDDSIEHVVSWSGDSDVSKYAGTPVRIRFYMKDSDIYSFRFR